MKFSILDKLVRLSFLFLVSILVITALPIGHRAVTPYVDDSNLVGTPRKPLVIVNGQTEQLPDGDYLTSVGGASLDGTPPTAAGDLEVTTINGSAPSTIAGLITNHVIKATSPTTIGDGFAIDDGITWAVNPLAGGGFRINEANASVTLGISQGNVNFGLDLETSASNKPGDSVSGLVLMTGTFDATLTNRTSYALQITNNSTKVSGGNLLQNRGAYCNVTGGDTNFCWYAIAGAMHQADPADFGEVTVVSTANVGGAPVVTGCTGAGFAQVGGGWKGRITAAIGSTTCTLTFANTLVSCTVTDETLGLVPYSLAGAVLTITSASLGATKVHYDCSRS